jgi:hypothetical protein
MKKIILNWVPLVLIFLVFVHIQLVSNNNIAIRQIAADFISNNKEVSEYFGAVKSYRKNYFSSLGVRFSFTKREDGSVSRGGYSDFFYSLVGEKVSGKLHIAFILSDTSNTTNLTGKEPWNVLQADVLQANNDPLTIYYNSSLGRLP